MKTFPYNKSSKEGRRLFQILDSQYNEGVLDSKQSAKAFDSYSVPTVAQCRTNKVQILMQSNLSGIKRPQIQIDADVELAWGDFAKDVSTLDFTHDGQELPISYIQPLDDDTMVLLVEAGLYRDKNFEELLSKIMLGEAFDAEANMDVMYLDIDNDLDSSGIPVLLVDPIRVVHEKYDPSEYTTIQDLTKRSARLLVELYKDGVKTDELMASDYEEDRQVFIPTTFTDVVSRSEEKDIINKANDEFSTKSDLLDEEIDLTDELKGSLGFGFSDEEDKIRRLKDKEALENQKNLKDFEARMKIEQQEKENQMAKEKENILERAKMITIDDAIEEEEEVIDDSNFMDASDFDLDGYEFTGSDEPIYQPEESYDEYEDEDEDELEL